MCIKFKNTASRFFFIVFQATDEHGERIHQIMKPVEKRYAGKNRRNMLADFADSSIRLSSSVTTDRRPTFKKYEL